MTTVLLVEAGGKMRTPLSEIALLNRIESLEDSIEPEEVLNVKLKVYQLEG